MNISCYTSRNAFQTNGYMVTTEKGNTVLIDAPLANKRVLDMLEENGTKITKILLTHGHCDHMESAAFLAEKYGAEIYIHELDKPKLNDDYLNLSEYFANFYLEPVPHVNGAHTVKDGDIIVQDEIELRVLHTPGHTSGSVCYIAGDMMFCGDTLFRESVGRTDMPDGDPAALKKSLELLSGLDADYTLFPGHGSPSSLPEEKRNNPYMKGADYDNML